MHVHNVYFWLKDGLESQALAAFAKGLNALTHDPAVKSGYYGKPAGTHRDVVENSYTYGLVLAFDDQEVPEFKSSHKPIVLRKNHEYDGEINETWDNYFSGTALFDQRPIWCIIRVVFALRPYTTIRKPR
jgi:hypothetical protein